MRKQTFRPTPMGQPVDVTSRNHVAWDLDDQEKWTLHSDFVLASVTFHSRESSVQPLTKFFGKPQ